MFSKTFAFIVFTFVFVDYSFGQKVETAKKPIEEPCQQTQILERQKKQIELNKDFRRQHFSLETLMPEKADSWIVEIVTTGGFTGRGLPTVIATSNGDLFVKEDNNTDGEQNLSAARKRLKSESLTEISEIIYTQISAQSEQKAAVSGELENFCSDCYQISITVGRRDANGEFQFFTNRSNNMLFSIGDFNRLHQIISGNSGN